MPSAEVGALRARLDLDNAGFVEGLAKSGATLGAFSRQFSALSTQIAGYAKHMAGALAAAFSVHAIRSALEYADAMGKLAQSAGTTTEEFSALAHAASLSDVGLEELAASLARLNRNVAESAGHVTEAGIALAGMGIRVRDSNGQVRNAVDMLGDIADKFAQFRDGANKAAIAQELFGRAGARLIPLLNQGRGGLEQLKEEARRLGVVVSSETAKQAEEFNDALKKLGNASRGALIDLGALVAGPLTSFAEKIMALQESFRNRNVITTILGDDATASEYRQQIKTLTEQLERMRKVREGEEAVGVRPERLAFLDQRIAKTEALIAKQKELMQTAPENPFTAEVIPATKGDAPNTKEAEIALERAWAEALKASKDAIEENQKQVEMYGEILQSLDTPLDNYRQKLLDIQIASRAGAVDQAKLAQAAGQAAWKMQADIAGAGSALTGALAELFNKNKGVAIANALVSTYEAVAKAQAAYVPPLSYAFMAAAMVRGLAQVRAIQSTNSHGGGGAATAGAAASAPAPAPAAPATDNGPSGPTRNPMAVHLAINGTVFNREHMRDLVESLNDYIKDGGRIFVDQ